MLNMFGTPYIAAAHEASCCCMPAARFYPATDILQQQDLKSDWTGHTAYGSVLGESEGTETEQSSLGSCQQLYPALRQVSISN